MRAPDAGQKRSPTPSQQRGGQRRESRGEQAEAGTGWEGAREGEGKERKRALIERPLCAGPRPATPRLRLTATPEIGVVYYYRRLQMEKLRLNGAE